MRALTAIFAFAVVLCSAPAAFAAAPASAGSGAARSGDAGLAPVPQTTDSAGAGASPSPCGDGQYKFLAAGARWKQTLNWSFRASSVPSGLGSSAALNTIKKAFSNITGARNDCGRADTVSATSAYLGTTTRKPNVTVDGGCGTRDGRNVVGFAPLNGSYAGYTCIWWSGDEIVEADMRLASNIRWSVTSSSCSAALMLEALVTHEAGHAFGLGHVGEANHGRLTMSVYIDGLCENQEATLGLGDMKGLEALY